MPFTELLTPDQQRKMKEAEYGTWLSPISSRLATESSVTFQELHNGKNGEVFWSEMRYEEAGRYVICSKSASGEHKEWTPKDYNARTLVHEYGGGSFLVVDDGIYFSNFKDQRLYKQENASASPSPLSPDNKGWRYADPVFSNKHGKIFCVREDHGVVERKEKKEAENTIISINPDNQEQSVLVSGNDFYASPKVSSDGSKIVWIQWNHPNMPWDTTELWMASLNEDGTALLPDSSRKVAGGGDISVMQPHWTDDDQLLFISDESQWWNLYTLTDTDQLKCLCVTEKELGGPHWIFSNYGYDSGAGKVAASHQGELGMLDVKSGKYFKIETGFTSHSFLRLTDNGLIACVAGGPTKFSCVITVDPTTQKVDVLKQSRALPLDEGYLSVPSTISWATDDGESSHGYFYPPVNKDFQGPETSRPPLLVKAHGGPTASTNNVLNLKIQYWTSRGFAVLDVDYRGSTGYGKEYRHRLKGQWGICDVEDCCSGAQFLANEGKVDGKRLCIDGGSAGGYTTLACLAFKSVFSAGASHYGICDLEVLAGETHKFESRYCDQMLAPMTPENMHIFHDRSPIKHIEKFNCPIAFFQGDEDKIVPPNQAKMMFDAVKEKGLPCAFVLFEGEQHGFRKAENVQKALDGEFLFFAKVFGYEPADKDCKMDVENL